jgi:hypothetical protein
MNRRKHDSAFYRRESIIRLMSACVIKHDATVRQPKSERTPHRSSWTAAFVLSALLIVPLALVVLAARADDGMSHPSDQELIESFLSHEADFQELTQMLESDRETLLLVGPVVELTNLARVATSAARIHHYESLLSTMGVKNFRYFPRSRTLILPVSEQSDSLPGYSKSYRYLPRDEPQHVVSHRGYGWRGPGVYVLTADIRIKGQWFIHHDTTLGIGLSPY